MTDQRRVIENLKLKFADNMKTKLVLFRKSVIREFDSISRREQFTPEALEQLTRKFGQQFKIPAPVMRQINGSVVDYQSQIAGVWNDYFSSNTLNAGRVDIDKMSALYQVDFDSINENSRKAIIKEIRAGVGAGVGYEAIRTKLTQRDFGDGEASTLANTALAQFDNAYMFDKASSAGITEFLYDGPRNPSSRGFCLKHLGNVYTIDEIKQMSNGQGLPVITACGGYNCVHYWTPYIRPASEIKSPTKGVKSAFTQDFNTRAADLALQYETTVKGIAIGKDANERSKSLIGNMPLSELSQNLYQMKKKDYLSFSKSDLFSDFKKHGPDFSDSLTIESYEKLANDIVQESTHYMAQVFKNARNQEELQYIFYGKNGYTVVNSASEIKGCYYHNDIEKCFNKQKEFKIWLQNKGAHWPK